LKLRFIRIRFIAAGPEEIIPAKEFLLTLPMLPHRYFVLNKPYNMVSQFVSSHKVGLLDDLNIGLPEGIHAVGRLDSLSEGLLILTTNKKITRLLFESEKPHKRTYLALVNKTVSEESLRKLREGVQFRIKGGEFYQSKPCEAELLTNPRIPFSSPFILSENAVYSWLRISLLEGKFHQVRKMIAAIHHRCKRLIRTSIEDLELADLQPGAVREIPEDEFFRLLKLEEVPELSV
jgi:23S rRNA pseudouridine2457 synthase